MHIMVCFSMFTWTVAPSLTWSSEITGLGSSITYWGRIVESLISSPLAFMKGMCAEQVKNRLFLKVILSGLYMLLPCSSLAGMYVVHSKCGNTSIWSSCVVALPALTTCALGKPCASEPGAVCGFGAVGN